MAIVLDGKIVAQNVKQEIKKEVDDLKKEGINPKLAVIMVGDDPSSKIYVRNKSLACNELGIEYEEYILKEETTMEDLLELIYKLNNDKTVNGILLQSPIPKKLDINKAFETISPKKDVDGFNPYNVGKLCLGQDTFISCTPNGIMKILEEYGINIEGKEAVVVGRSNIVGKPMIQCLLNKNATVTVCHSRTVDLGKVTSRADILVVAIGKERFITKDMVKEGAVVIDVGINRMNNGKICGDVDFEEVEKIASYVTPVPGGVGPMTIAMLMKNVVKAAKIQNK